jgi:hypothetical protein
MKRKRNKYWSSASCGNGGWNETEYGKERGDWQMTWPLLVFFEYAEELHIFVLRRRKDLNTKTTSPPWISEGSRNYSTSRTITSRLRYRT